MKRTARTFATAAASLAAVGSLAGCGDATADVATDQEPDQAASSTNSPQSAADYLDGTYSATGSYIAPSGGQSIEVTLTLTDNAVSAVEVEPLAEDPQSEGYQEKFASGIASEVVGIPIDQLNVDKVAGSSLTVGGFTDAVDQIMAEAAA